MFQERNWIIEQGELAKIGTGPKTLGENHHLIESQVDLSLRKTCFWGKDLGWIDEKHIENQTDKYKQWLIPWNTKKVVQKRKNKHSMLYGLAVARDYTDIIPQTLNLTKITINYERVGGWEV